MIFMPISFVKFQKSQIVEGHIWQWIEWPNGLQIQILITYFKHFFKVLGLIIEDKVKNSHSLIIQEPWHKHESWMIKLVINKVIYLILVSNHTIKKKKINNWWRLLSFYLIYHFLRTLAALHRVRHVATTLICLYS